MTDQAEKLMADATQIAALVAGTNTDHRHILYKAIATELMKRAQGYTATQFLNIAIADKTGAELTCRLATPKPPHP